MKDELISYKTAQLAKEKGFEWKTLNAYDGVPMVCSHSESIFKPLNYNSPSGGNYVSAPAQSLLQRWLREEHFIDIDITPTVWDSNRVYRGFIHQDFIRSEIHLKNICREFSYNINYEEALEKGLQEALKLINNE